MSESLYGDGSPAPAKPKAPSLLEQLEGVFTAPTQLFKRMESAPSWAPALIFLIVMSIVLTIAWASKVDVDAMLRPILERNPNVQPEQIDTIIQMQGKFMMPFGIVGSIFIISAVVFFMGLVYWLIGMGTHEGEARPSYMQALVASSVPGLALVPQMLLTIVLCFARGVGGLTPEKIPPTSLGYFLHTESLKLGAFLYSLELFAIFSWVLVFLACRHTMRLKPAGAFICAFTVALISVGFKVLGAR